MLKRMLSALGLRPKSALPSVHGEATADWYDAAYRLIDEYTVPYWHSKYYAVWTVIADRVRRAGCRDVLDIGCGSGQLAACLYELGGISSYVGLDFSSEAVAIARRACPQGRFVVGDALTSPVFDETRYDVVVCTEMLEHVERDLDIVRRFAPGVRAIFTVPNFPFASHVRHFSDSAEVAARYAGFFDSFDVLPIRGYAEEPHVYFLCEGKRKDGSLG